MFHVLEANSFRNLTTVTTDSVQQIALTISGIGGTAPFCVIPTSFSREQKEIARTLGSGLEGELDSDWAEVTCQYILNTLEEEAIPYILPLTEDYYPSVIEIDGFSIDTSIPDVLIFREMPTEEEEFVQVQNNMESNARIGRSSVFKREEKSQ